MLGLGMVALAAVLSALHESENLAERLGRALGAVLAGLLIAALIRFVYIKVRGGERRLLSGWLWLIAGIVALAGAVGQIDSEEKGTEIDSVREHDLALISTEANACTDEQRSPVSGTTTPTCIPMRFAVSRAAVT